MEQPKNNLKVVSNKKNARVIPVSGADHSDAIDEGIGLMKELFNIP